MITVVAVSGSRREDSSTRKALEVVLSAASEAGADTDLLNSSGSTSRCSTPTSTIEATPNG